ncbi:MAG: S-layer homology domain-containing protein [Eubacteriales bacterium]|nr:S-layer homology domain-containing protein [Eubacteriales bacterium]
MKKLFILTLISICTSIAVCSAADIEVTINNETGEVSVSGSPGAGNAEKKMMLYALKEGDVLTGLNPDETQKETEIFSAIEYCEADIEGNYTFPNVQMRNADDKYIFYVTADHSDTTYQSDPLYVISESAAESLRDVFLLNDAASIKTAITNKSVKLDAPVLNLITDDATLEIIAQKLANKTYDSNDAIIKAVNIASFETAIETTVPAAIMDSVLYPECNESMKEYTELANSVNLMAEKSHLSTFKQIKKLSQSERINILESVSKTGYTGSDDMFDKISMAVIMDQIKNCSGHGDITGILSDYQDAIERFSYSSYSSNKYLNDLNKTLLIKSFTKTKDLSDYITKYYADKAAASSNISSGTSSSKVPDTLLVIGEKVVVPPVTPPEPILASNEDRFNDISDVDWAKEAINYLAEKGIVSGRGEKQFAPKDNVKREEFVTMLVRAFDLKNDGNSDMNFSDVNTDEWYAPYIKTAYALGIVKGVSEEEFGTGIYISRQDMAVMITRAKNIETADSMPENTFADEDQIADYARVSVAYLKNAGVINGYDDGSFRPYGNATRAETAKILYGLLK